MNRAMSVRRISRSLLGTVAAGLLFGLSSATATETICTYIIQSGEYPIPMDEREGDRQVQARVKPGFVAEGDNLAGKGKPVAAMDAYAKVFSGFQYRGVFFDAGRCLSVEFYQGAADKLRVVASAIAEQRRAKGYLLDESHEYGGDMQPGALRLYLISNQYDLFVSHAISYAESELLRRDTDGALVGLIENRLDELERTREIGTEAHYRQYVNDLTPLLDEELAAFDKLVNFDEKLKAHLAPLYPTITDHWLAEEARHFDEFEQTDGVLPKKMFLERAGGALEAGADRLVEHPRQVARLKARANARGKALMKMASTDASGEGLKELMALDYHAYARTYFEFAGNQEQSAKAGRLSDERQEAVAKEMEMTEVSIRADVEKMQKSEAEQAAFQEKADEMAAEFGFDLEE